MKYFKNKFRLLNIHAARFTKNNLPSDVRIIRQIMEWDEKDIPFGFLDCPIPARMFFVDDVAFLEMKKIDTFNLVKKGCYIGNIYGVPVLLEGCFDVLKKR